MWRMSSLSNLADADVGRKRGSRTKDKMGVDTAHLQHQPKTMIAFRGWPRAIILALASAKRASSPIGPKTLTGGDMTAKVEIVKLLGEQAILLPSLIAEALNANDRIKLRLTCSRSGGACIVSGGRRAISAGGAACRRLVGPPVRSHYCRGSSARRRPHRNSRRYGASGRHSGRYGDHARASRSGRSGKRKILAGAVDRLAKEGSLCSRQRDRPR